MALLNRGDDGVGKFFEQDRSLTSDGKLHQFSSAGAKLSLIFTLHQHQGILVKHCLLFFGEPLLGPFFGGHTSSCAGHVCCIIFLHSILQITQLHLGPNLELWHYIAVLNTHTPCGITLNVWTDKPCGFKCILDTDTPCGFKCTNCDTAPCGIKMAPSTCILQTSITLISDALALFKQASNSI